MMPGVKVDLIWPFILFMVLGPAIQGQSIRVMSYNIRYDTSNDSLDRWDLRKSEIVQMLKKYQPEIVGVQEALAHQVDFLNEELTGWTYFGVGRDDGATKGEYSAILYDSSAYKLVSGSTFWLSNSPWEVSVGWDAALPRICTYGLFQQKATNQLLWIFNTHFDHRGREAREMSAQLIVDKIETINLGEIPVILMGDFNALEDEAPIERIKAQYLLTSRQKVKGPEGTFNGFSKLISDRRIDYVFLQRLEPVNYFHLDDLRFNGRQLSDHQPVFLLAEWKN